MEKSLYLFIVQKIFQVLILGWSNWIHSLSSEKDSNNVGIGQNAIVFEDVVSPSKEGATYYGIGYNVSTQITKLEIILFNWEVSKKNPVLVL